MTLLEIQKAAESLSIEEKRHLIIFLLRRLRNNQVELPPVRDIPKKTIENGSRMMNRVIEISTAIP
jgi:hypothetical protein